MAGTSRPNGTAQPRRSAFANYLLWCLGCAFLFDSALVLGSFFLTGTIGLSGAVFERTVTVGFFLGSAVVAIVVGLRLRARLWMVVPVWIISTSALSLLNGLVVDCTVLFFEPSVGRVAADFMFVPSLLIGSAMLLRRWLGERRRAKAEVAATAAVFE